MVCKVCEARRRKGRERIRRFRSKLKERHVLKIFTVYDSKTGIYCSPFYLKARGEALRSFIDTASGNSKDTLIASHPEDFTLFELGEYDDCTGTFDLYPAPVSCGNALELLPRKE